MSGNGITVRIAAFLFFVQAAAFSLVYFLRLDGRIMQIPAVKAAAENLRQSRNIDAVWTKADGQQRVWGYVDRHSILAGEPINIMLSVKPGQAALKGALIISRVGVRNGKVYKLESWHGDEQIIQSQDLVNSAAAIGANWNVSYSVDRTENWKTGFYSLDFASADGKSDYDIGYFVVKPSERTGDVLVKLSTNTFQAYNNWGGSGFYNSALFSGRDMMVSFDRPTTPGFFDYESYFVAWMEDMASQRGLKVGYISDFDLHEDPGIMDGYKLFISQGHDEYWTKEMFDAVENRIFKQGKNALFLGANTAYWQVRYADVNQSPGGRNWGRQMICYKEWEDPISRRFDTDSAALPFVTNMFRWKNRRPETMLVGVAYQNYFQPDDAGPYFDYEVARTDLPFFEGTGWKAGDKLKGLLGYEWDNRDPEGDGSRLWSATDSMNAELGKDRLTVLFSGAPVDYAGKKGLAEAVYWESPAGAKVFSSGSIRWDWGLGKPGFESEPFKIFNRNLVDAFVK